MAYEESSLNPNRWWILAAVCLGLFMALLDVTIVNIAIPAIGNQLHSSFSTLQWVVDAYTIPLASLIILGGMLGDRFGKKTWFMIGLGIFTAGSLMAAMSPQLVLMGLEGNSALIAARVVQGCGGAILLPLTLSIIATTFRGKERGIAFGIYGGVSALGTAAGPLVGGALVQWAGWPWIFAVNVPVGAVAGVLSVLVLRRDTTPTDAKPFDFPGVITLTAFICSLVFGLIEGEAWGWFSPAILGLFVTAFVSFVLFLLRESTTAHPFIDLRLFKKPGFVRANLAAFALSAALYAILFPLSIYLQNFLGFSSWETGLRLLCMSAVVIVAAPLSGAMLDRWGASRILAWGTAFLVAAIAALLLLGSTSDPAAWLRLLPALVFAGLASGMMNPSLSDAAMASVPRQSAGTAAGINNAFRQLGTAFGIAFLGARMAHGYSVSLKRGLQELETASATLTQDGSLLYASLFLQKAGVFEGSTGLANPPAELLSVIPLSLVSPIQDAVRRAFLDGLHAAIWAAMVIAVLGWGAVIALGRKEKQDK